MRRSALACHLDLFAEGDWTATNDTVLLTAHKSEAVPSPAFETLTLRVDGAKLPWPRALLRFGVALVSLGACGLGFLWCFVDRERRAWHDIAVRSRVLRMPEK